MLLVRLSGTTGRNLYMQHDISELGRNSRLQFISITHAFLQAKIKNETLKQAKKKINTYWQISSTESV